MKYEVGKIVNAVSAQVVTERTSPPPSYTEEILLSEMMKAYKFAKSEEDRAILREIAGIGTARTRAEIISGLIKRGFLERKKVGKRQQIVVTREGLQLLSLLPQELKDISLTARWERALQLVAQGRADPEAVVAKVKEFLNAKIPSLLGSS